jgi:DNA-binding PadR family transcriptional regulator
MARRSNVVKAAEEVGESGGFDDRLPLTCYATLGILNTVDEMTAVDVQERAHRLLRFFYWTPALSHIRRELNRLEELGYVSSREERVGRVKIVLKYQVTDAGEAALRAWAESDTLDPLVVKNPMLLRLWLGRRAGDPSLVLRSLERHIDRAVSERDALKDVVRTMEERRTLLLGRDKVDKAAVNRTEWSLEVMAYALRSHEHEIRSSKKLLDGLQALSGA